MLDRIKINVCAYFEFKVVATKKSNCNQINYEFNSKRKDE